VRTGWRAFGVWAVVGSLFGFALVALASIGLFILVLAIAAAALVATGERVRVWPEITGVLAGLGAFPLVVGLLNVGSTPCPSSGSAASGAASVSCGGFDPVPWLAAGTALIAAGLAAYSVLRR